MPAPVTEALAATPVQLDPVPRPAAKVAASNLSTPPAPPSTTWPSDVLVEYLPRSALSVGPRPLLPVLIDFPSFVGDAERYTGEFEIFIDDNGGVVRVAQDDPDLPPILVQAVRDAFMQARFAPGELDGQAVRSRIRIEVVFESRPASS